jgi:molecular chaperone GrpE
VTQHEDTQTKEAPESEAPETAETAEAPEASAARGSETSFHDAEAPAAAQPRAADADEVTEPTAPAGTGQQDLAALTAKARERDEYLALAQRTQADFENYRRRMARESAVAGERGVAKVAKELLPALDHLQLALKAAEEGHPEVVKGFAMVRDELTAALARVGIESFSPQGEAFDPNEHEAMAQMPVEGAEPGTVAEVYQQGYRINGTVLRPARVVVAQ